MAPEQTGRSTPAADATDVYGLGATLYHLATENDRFGHSDEVIKQVLKAPCPAAIGAERVPREPKSSEEHGKSVRGTPAPSWPPT